MDLRPHGDLVPRLGKHLRGIDSRARQHGAQKLSHRELYVGNTRYRGAHAIYVTNKDELYQRLGRRDARRELASEFVLRQRYAYEQDQRIRQQQAVGQTLRL